MFKINELVTIEKMHPLFKIFANKIGFGNHCEEFYIKLKSIDKVSYHIAVSGKIVKPVSELQTSFETMGNKCILNLPTVLSKIDVEQMNLHKNIRKYLACENITDNSKPIVVTTGGYPENPDYASYGFKQSVFTDLSKIKNIVFNYETAGKSWCVVGNLNMSDEKELTYITDSYVYELNISDML